MNKEMSELVTLREGQQVTTLYEAKKVFNRSAFNGCVKQIKWFLFHASLRVQIHSVIEKLFESQSAKKILPYHCRIGICQVFLQGRRTRYLIVTHSNMSDEEYSFIKIKRSSRKINLMKKQSTPLTPFYLSSLPTVNEWEEDSYLANHSQPLDKIMDPQVKRVISPLTLWENPAEEESFSVEDLPGETILNAKQKEDANTEISFFNSTSRTPKKNFKRKKISKLLIKEKVDKWVIQQLNNIEEAAKHNLVIENV
ncbi:uncharacterized protein [Dendropsophus ebraccatus]|uniref:uncharacterized protein n=1 Tax=Dendropsophus ebraccatus TaxID=150705 RepID=UPI00383104D1